MYLQIFTIDINYLNNKEHCVYSVFCFMSHPTHLSLNHNASKPLSRGNSRWANKSSTVWLCFEVCLINDLEIIIAHIFPSP